MSLMTTSTGTKEGLQLRQTVPLRVVRDELIGRVNMAVGRDVSFITAHITFSRCDGKSNWNAAPGIQALDILEVFIPAVEQMQDHLNIAW
jgi:hypothetical protein